MVAKKPATLDEYTNWLQTEHDVESLEEHRINYETVAYEMKSTFQQSSFWSNCHNKSSRTLTRNTGLSIPITRCL